MDQQSFISSETGGGVRPSPIIDALFAQLSKLGNVVDPNATSPGRSFDLDPEAQRIAAEIPWGDDRQPGTGLRPNWEHVSGEFSCYPHPEIDDPREKDPRIAEFEEDWLHGSAETEARRRANRERQKKLRSKKMAAGELHPDDVSKGAKKHGELMKRIAERREQWENHRFNLYEKGLRSAKCPTLRRILQITPRRVLCGDTKGPVKRHRCKIFALDSKYITLDTRRYGAVIIDLDRRWDLMALREALLERVGERAMPNLIIGEYAGAGMYVRPHLVRVLPVGAEVWQNKPRSVAFYDRIHLALLNALLPLGADHGQVANRFKFKNPLSPHWSCEVVHEHWATLAEIGKELNLKVNARKIERKAAELAGILTDGKSCNNWRFIQAVTTQVAINARRAKDKDYLAACQAQDRFAALLKWSKRAVAERVQQEIGSSEQIEEMIWRHCTYFAKHWNPDWERQIDRGRDAEVIAARSAIEGAPIPLVERQRIAQAVTVTNSRAATVEAVAKAILDVVPSGVDPFECRPAIVKKLAGIVPQSTAYHAFRDAVKRAAEISNTVCRYIDETNITHVTVEGEDAIISTSGVTPDSENERILDQPTADQSGYAGNQRNLASCRPSDQNSGYAEGYPDPSGTPPTPPGGSEEPSAGLRWVDAQPGGADPPAGCCGGPASSNGDRGNQSSVDRAGDTFSGSGASFRPPTIN